MTRRARRDSRAALVLIVPYVQCVHPPALLRVDGPLDPLESSVGDEEMAELVVTNEGGRELTIQDITFEEEPALSIGPQFWLTDRLQDVALEPGAQEAVGLRFVPLAEGEYQATVSVSSTAGTQEVVVVGKGQEGQDVATPTPAVQGGPSSSAD